MLMMALALAAATARAAVGSWRAYMAYHDVQQIREAGMNPAVTLNPATPVSLLKDIVNDQLLPRMLKHGFPVKGLHFEWDNSIDYTPEQQLDYEKMILDRFEVDPQYLIDKYGVPIIGQKKQQPAPTTELARPFFD